MYAFGLLLSILAVFILFFRVVKILNNRFVTYKKTTPTYTLLFVRNNEECIEGVLRHLISSANKDKNFYEKIIVIDVNSSDNTVSIVKHLSKKYSFIHLLANSRRHQ